MEETKPKQLEPKEPSKVPEVKKEPKIEPKKPKRVDSYTYDLNLRKNELKINGENVPLNKAPFKTFAGVFVPIETIEKMFKITQSGDGFLIERKI
jgi:hypothetical protein